MRNAFILTLLILVLTSVAHGGITVGEKPQSLTLSGKSGGRVDGRAWSSEEIKGRVHVLFYVDPDEQNANKHVERAINEQNFPHDKYHTLAVVNMKATWLPNVAIEARLKSKQKEYPDVSYLKDFEKTLVKNWELSDDASVIVAFDKDGRVVFRKDGALNPEETNKLVETIKTLL